MAANARADAQKPKRNDRAAIRTSSVCCCLILSDADGGVKRVVAGLCGPCGLRACGLGPVRGGAEWRGKLGVENPVVVPLLAELGSLSLDEFQMLKTAGCGVPDSFAARWDRCRRLRARATRNPAAAPRPDGRRSLSIGRSAGWALWQGDRAVGIGLRVARSGKRGHCRREPVSPVGRASRALGNGVARIAGHSRLAVAARRVERAIPGRCRPTRPRPHKLIVLQVL